MKQINQSIGPPRDWPRDPVTGTVIGPPELLSPKTTNYLHAEISQVRTEAPEPLHPDAFPGTDEGSQYDRTPSVETVRREVAEQASTCSALFGFGLPCCRQVGHTGRHAASNGLVWVDTATSLCLSKANTDEMLLCRRPQGHDGRHEATNAVGTIERWAADSMQQACAEPVKPTTIESAMLEAARSICRDLWGYSPQAAEDVASVLVEPGDAFRMAFLAGLHVAEPILRALVDDQRIGIIARQARQLLDEMNKMDRDK